MNASKIAQTAKSPMKTAKEAESEPRLNGLKIRIKNVPSLLECQLFLSWVFFCSAYDSFLSETSKEHFLLDENCEFEKSAWLEVISRCILAKTEHIENLTKMQQQNQKRAQNCLRHLVECVRDQKASG